MPSVYIDIDLRNIDTSDLLDELEGRWLNDGDQKQLMSMLKYEWIGKLELFFKIKDQYTINELEEMFKERFDHVVPKEQLALPL